MTAYRFVTLTCDACGELFDSGDSRSVKDARAKARAEHWRHVQREDLCPLHFGHYWSEVAGWVYHPEIAATFAEQGGYVLYAAGEGPAT